MQFLVNNIKSSVVKGIAYSNQKLTVQLVDRVYTYDKVPANVAVEFLNSESKGKFYGQNIKGEYDLVENN